eukprot:3459464-Prymnesium_polylepis.1
MKNISSKESSRLKQRNTQHQTRQRPRNGAGHTHASETTFSRKQSCEAKEKKAGSRRYRRDWRTLK